MELKPGDYVDLDDVSIDQRRAVVQAFIDAGALDHDGAFRLLGCDTYTGWSVEDDKVWSLPYTASDFDGRLLTVDEVLGNA